MSKLIASIESIAEAIATLLQPHAEVVVHDIKKQQIIAIYHPLSKRDIGDDSLLSELPTEHLTKDVIGPYQKTNWDGRTFKSISSIVRDEKGKPGYLLCINLDISRFETMKQWLTDIIDIDSMLPQPASIFKEDWQEKINQQIHVYLTQQQWVLEHLTRAQKQQLIQVLKQQGAFTVTNAAQYIARILNISRATVYNYLRKNDHETTQL